MALIQVRVFEVRIVTTGEAPGPAETYVDGGTIEAAREILADLDAINPAGGIIEATIEAPTAIAVELERVEP